MLKKATQEGFEASAPTKRVSSYKTWLFSGGWPRFDGWPAKNIHTDLEFAKSCGMPDRGASGAMLLRYLTELMLDLFGEDWLRHGEMNLRFIRIIRPGDRITAKARVREKQMDGGRARLNLDVWCDNQQGQQVAVGTGTGWLA